MATTGAPCHCTLRKLVEVSSHTDCKKASLQRSLLWGCLLVMSIRRLRQLCLVLTLCLMMITLGLRHCTLATPC